MNRKPVTIEQFRLLIEESQEEKTLDEIVLGMRVRVMNITKDGKFFPYLQESHKFNRFQTEYNRGDIVNQWREETMAKMYRQYLSNFEMNQTII